MPKKPRYFPAYFGVAVFACTLWTAGETLAAEPAAQVEEIVVTGSRIKQSQLTSVSPVVGISQEAIDMTGQTRIEDTLNNLPQVAADFGGNVSNGATGAATVNLRGLGAQRTLVLINGRRLMPGDPSQNGNSTPDLNQIPSAMIRRVDILTGGSSAVYGADAVAGVVNFVMMDDFEGVQFDMQTSGYNHDQSDGLSKSAQEAAGYKTPNDASYTGETVDFNFLLGLNSEDGRGNATAYFGYRKLDPVLQQSRDYSACALNSGDALDSCGGSSTTNPARFQKVNQDVTSTQRGVESGPSMTPRGVDGALVPYDSATMAYNFAPLNYYQRADKRYSGGVFAHLDMSDRATTYAEFQFMDDTSDAQIAPSGAFRGSGGPFANGAWSVNCDNPFLNASEVDFFCTQQGVAAPNSALVSIARRGVEGGGRSNTLEHTSYRGVLGVRGNIDDQWSYDAYGQYGTTKFESTYFNDYSISNMSKALQVVNDANANPICKVNADADQSNDDPSCVPWNIFTPVGATDAAVNYVSVPGFQNGDNTQKVVSGSVTGDLTDYGVKLPWSEQGLAVVFGAEYRDESQHLHNDREFSTGDLIGQGGVTANTTGNYDVKEVFTEMRLPLVSGKRFAEDASLEAGYRYSDYSLGFDTDTYKFGGDWMPIRDLRFRAAYERAVRVPNVTELFRPNVVQLDGSTDPCAVDVPGDTPSLSLAECQNTGMTAAQYGQVVTNPAGQYNGLTGGLPTLQPEEADTYTAGFVVTPERFPGFSLTVDYFNIKIDKVINNMGADLILNTCATDGSAQFCNLVHRSPGGSLWLGTDGYIIDVNANLGSLKTTGYDIELNNSLELPGGLGQLNLNMLATYVQELTTVPIPGFPNYDCAGLYGNVCGVPVPEFRHTTRLTWNTPWRLDLAFTWRYSSNVKEENTDRNPNFSFGSFENSDKGIDAQSYYDIAAQYQVETGLTNLTFRAGVNNILDSDPPIFGQDISVAVYVSGNTFPQAYDTMGRYMFLSASAHF